MSNNNSRAFDVYEIEYDVQLAASIIEARMSKNITQATLARLLNTHQPAIARAENGNRPPSHSLLKKIARALGLKLLPPRFQMDTQAAIRFSSFEVKTNTDTRESSKKNQVDFPEAYAFLPKTTVKSTAKFKNHFSYAS